jgi:hypothetical protein
LSKIWVDLDFTYDHRIIAYRLDDGVAGTLKDGALKKAQNALDIYNYSGAGTLGVGSEIEIDSSDFIPLNNPLEIDESV